MIYKFSGDDLGVTRTENFALCEWRAGDAKVVISYSRKGEAMECHFAANKAALRYIKVAIEEAVNWVFLNFEWCKMILSVGAKKGVLRMIQKLDFKHVYTIDGTEIYARCRNG